MKSVLSIFAGQVRTRVLPRRWLGALKYRLSSSKSVSVERAKSTCRGYFGIRIEGVVLNMRPAGPLQGQDEIERSPTVALVDKGKNISTSLKGWKGYTLP